MTRFQYRHVHHLFSNYIDKSKLKKMKSSKKLLFIIKERSSYGSKTSCYGLVNSCEFISNALSKIGYECKVVQVNDNNDIDREVFNYKPTHVFIEALWVIPEKFVELSKLHPKVKWIIRIHSMIPFLVTEGMCFDWINKYLELKRAGINIEVSLNNLELYKDFEPLYGKDNISYSPNIYKPSFKGENKYFYPVNKTPVVLNIGCFGALRVLKNHVQQAVYSIIFAEKSEKILNFHINVSDFEKEESTPVLKNLRALFKDRKHKLIEHPWL